MRHRRPHPQQADDELDRKEWVHSEHCILCSFVSCVCRAASFHMHPVAPNLVGLALSYYRYKWLSIQN